MIEPSLCGRQLSRVVILTTTIKSTNFNSKEKHRENTEKIWKSIAKKFKNSTAAKEAAIQEPNVFSSADLTEAKKPLEDVLNEKTTIEQQVVTGKAESVSLIQDTASIIGNIETPANACEMVTEVCSFDVKHKPVIDTDTRLCEDVNKSSEGFQPICENSEKVQQTSVKTDEQESNASNDLSPKPRFDDNATDKREKPLTTQAVIVGSVGAALLVSSVVAYILKMYAIAVMGGIIGLACVSFALYNALKPDTKLEKVEDVEQTDVKPFFSPSL